MAEYKAKQENSAHSHDKEFELKYCERCIQMTNHLWGDCQKCKAPINDSKGEQGEGWISCDERLPKIGERVIICFLGYLSGEPVLSIDKMIQYHSNKPEWQRTSTTEIKITHWQPLPAPPKVEK